MGRVRDKGDFCRIGQGGLPFIIWSSIKVDVSLILSWSWKNLSFVFEYKTLNFSPSGPSLATSKPRGSVSSISSTIKSAHDDYWYPMISSPSEMCWKIGFGAFSRKMTLTMADENSLVLDSTSLLSWGMSRIHAYNSTYNRVIQLRTSLFHLALTLSHGHSWVSLWLGPKERLLGGRAGPIASHLVIAIAGRLSAIKRDWVHLWGCLEGFWVLRGLHRRVN